AQCGSPPVLSSDQVRNSGANFSARFRSQKSPSPSRSASVYMSSRQGMGRTADPRNYPGAFGLGSVSMQPAWHSGSGTPPDIWAPAPVLIPDVWAVGASGTSQAESAAPIM